MLFQSAPTPLESPFPSLPDNSVALHPPISPDYNSPQPQFHISYLSVKYTDYKPSINALSTHNP